MPPKQNKPTQKQTSQARDETLNTGQQQNPLINNPTGEPVGAGDARITIEVNAYKYTDVPLASTQMENLTPADLAEAIRAFRNKAVIVHGQEQEEASEGSGDSHQSRASVFSRLGDKSKRTQKKITHKTQSQTKNDEAIRLRKLTELQEQIRKDEQAKLELRIKKRFQEEKEKLGNQDTSDIERLVRKSSRIRRSPKRI